MWLFGPQGTEPSALDASSVREYLHPGRSKVTTACSFRAGYIDASAVFFTEAIFTAIYVRAGQTFKEYVSASQRVRSTSVRWVALPAQVEIVAAAMQS